LTQRKAIWDSLGQTGLFSIKVSDALAIIKDGLLLREGRMDWKRVLVFGDPSQEGRARISTAAAACLVDQAAQLDVCLTGLLPEIPYSYRAAGVLEAYQEALAQQRLATAQTIETLRVHFEKANPNISFTSLEVDMSGLSSAAAALGHSYDVVVLAQPSGRERRLQELLLKGALIGAGRPCLILPQWIEPRPLTGRAMVGWKGAPGAARAMRDSIPLLRRMQMVRIFEAAEGRAMKGEGPADLARVAEYLAAHGVHVEAPMVTAPPDELLTSSGEALLEEAAAFGADLLVMGGYGHPRLVEVVFGGATQTVLEGAQCAVLMSH
jgi:nucleotide-binding universal stress UspA family protein